MNRGLFDSFNARPVEPEKVGRSFIYSKIFTNLISNNSSVVIGPRGSGKTTYFKMLTLPALLSWKGQQRNKVVDSINFLSIYVPTDFSWFPDFRHPVGLFLDPDVDVVLSYARFRNTVLRRIVETLEAARSDDVGSDPILKKFHISISKSEENSLVNRIAKNWSLELEFGGIKGLIDAINTRNRHVQRLTSASYYNPDNSRRLIEEASYLHDRIFDDLVSFADAIENTTGKKFSWAVCFDEVEIAPDPIKQEIWSSLRSFDQRFVIKLSASPYDEALWQRKGPNDAMKNNDYQEIWLLQERTATVEFSEKLFSGICSELGIPPQRQEYLLGPSYYDDDFEPALSTRKSPTAANERAEAKKQSKKSRNKTGFYEKKFNSLSRKDPTFKKFLDRVGVDMDKFSEMSGNERAFVRKFISSVVIRDAYLREFSGGVSPHLKSKKAIDRFFTGKTTIFTICEGNPRWLLVVLRPMMEEYAAAREHPRRAISREIQAKCLEDGVSTLLSILSTISSEGSASIKGPSLIELIERAGDFFFEEVLGPSFVPEPTLSFEVDETIDEHTLDYLGAAINQGALMLIPPDRNRPKIQIHDNKTLYGQRLRLSFYLAPRYRLPLVRGRAKKLSTILMQQADTSASEEQIMFDLFGEEK